MSNLDGRIIKPSLAFESLPDKEFLERALAVRPLFDSSYYTGSALPVSKEQYEGSITRYLNSTAAAVDGGKKAQAEKKNARADLTFMMRQLGHHVESACKGDMNAFLASGFQPARTGKAPTPVLSEAVYSINHGDHSGEALIRLKPVEDALYHELQYGPMVNGAAPTTWATQNVTSLRTPVVLNGLTPGTTYAFQVRPFLKSGRFGDASDPVTFMIT